jgi:hypothetical protein
MDFTRQTVILAKKDVQRPALKKMDVTNARRRINMEYGAIFHAPLAALKLIISSVIELLELAKNVQMAFMVQVVTKNVRKIAMLPKTTAIKTLANVEHVYLDFMTRHALNVLRNVIRPVLLLDVTNAKIQTNSELGVNPHAQ